MSDIFHNLLKAGVQAFLEDLSGQPQLPRPVITPIVIDLTRDQARTVQLQYFPYLEKLCATKIRDAGRDWDQILNCRAVQSLFFSVKMQIDKKLVGPADKFKFKFSYAEGLTFYKLLMGLPIKGEETYLINLRQFISDIIFKQLIK